MSTDIHTFIGGYPFRHLPHPEPEVLSRVLEREGLSAAWVGHLPTAFHRDPSGGNEELLSALAPHPSLLPTPVVRPDWPGWERAFAEWAECAVPAVRAYPQQWGMGAGHAAMLGLAEACGEAGVPLLLTVRFEDLRQRHWMDAAGDLSAAAVRALARGSARACIVVAAAGRAMIEEVHWGLTPGERERIWWDISWVWGPPEDDLAHLLRTVGATRLVHGSGWPLRLAQVPRANLALLPEPATGAALATAEQIVHAARDRAR